MALNVSFTWPQIINVTKKKKKGKNIHVPWTFTIKTSLVLVVLWERNPEAGHMIKTWNWILQHTTGASSLKVALYTR